MTKEIDINSWKRKPHYEFFKDCDNPFFGMCANVDITNLHRQVKEEGHSFFLAALYLSLKAANDIPEFHYRIQGEKVVEVDELNAGCTILAEDETFRFCYFGLSDSYQSFEAEGRQNIEATKLTEGLQLRDDRSIHYSTIPWVSFTSFVHARKYNIGDTVPKIVHGKYFEENGRIKMPVAVEVHHALADGLHVGRFYERMQQLLDAEKPLTIKCCSQAHEF